MNSTGTQQPRATGMVQELSNTQRNISAGDTAQGGLGSAEFRAGLDALEGLLHPKWLCDIQCAAFLQDTGFSLGSLLRTWPQERTNSQPKGWKLPHQLVCRTGWEEEHFLAQGEGQVGSYTWGLWWCRGKLAPGVWCVHPQLCFAVTSAWSPLRRSHLAKAPLGIYCPEESTNDIPAAQVICVAPRLDFGDSATLKDNSQPEITHTPLTWCPPACFSSPPPPQSTAHWKWLTLFSSILYLMAFELQREVRKPHHFSMQLNIMQPHYWRTPTKYAAKINSPLNSSYNIFERAQNTLPFFPHSTEAPTSL